MGLLPMDADLLPPSDDRIFKLILTKEEAAPALRDLISTIIGRPVTDVMVRNSEMLSQDTEEKQARLDINCRIEEDGTQVDVEMYAHRVLEYVKNEPENLKGKGIFYACDLHSSQPSRGEGRYDNLAQTWQVTFCMFTVFPERKSFVNTFSLRHDEDNGLLSDQLRVVYVELSKLRKILKKPVGEMTDLEKWSIFFRYANIPRYRKVVNEIIDSKEALAVASELLMSVSKDEHERAVYRSRRMAETDRLSDLATAKDIGRREGREEGIGIGRAEGIGIGRAGGISIGRAEGIDIERKKIVLRMLSRGMPISGIRDMTGLTEAEIKEVIDKQKQ